MITKEKNKKMAIELTKENINRFKKLLNQIEMNLDSDDELKQRAACLTMGTITAFMDCESGFEHWQLLVLSKITDNFIQQNPLSAHEGTTTLQ